MLVRNSSAVGQEYKVFLLNSLKPTLPQSCNLYQVFFSCHRCMKKKKHIQTLLVLKKVEIMESR